MSHLGLEKNWGNQKEGQWHN